VLAILLQQGHRAAGRDAGHHERRWVAAGAASPCHVDSAGTSARGHEYSHHEQENAGPPVLARPSRAGLPVS
jgi:hypothetical protein